MLSIKELSHSYKTVNVLDDINIDFDGRRHCITGPNGSGKTTLLCILAGLIDLQSGLIQLQNKRFTDLKAHTALASDCIKIPDFMTANDVLNLNASIFDKAFPDSLIDALFLRPHLNKVITALSAGNLKKLGIVAAMMREPQFLLLDEPNIALDKPSLDKLMALLAHYQGTVIVSSNEPKLFTNNGFVLQALSQ